MLQSTGSEPFEQVKISEIFSGPKRLFCRLRVVVIYV
jgi:hypothetical protein